jgi:hypothetical protein
MKTTSSSNLEKDVVKGVRLALQKYRIISWRNNVGKWRDAFGNWITYGLAVGSSDWICIYPYKVKPSDVGRTIGVFAAVETKKLKGGVLSEDQANYIEQVNLNGGIAGVARSPDDVERLIEEFNNRSLTNEF